MLIFRSLGVKIRKLAFLGQRLNFKTSYWEKINSFFG